MDQVYDGIVSRHLNRYFSRPLARLLRHSSVTPNQLSLIALGLAAMSGLSFLNGSPKLGGVLAQASSIVDGADGDLARLTQSTSSFGGFLDAILDRYADSLIILGLTKWTAKRDVKARSWIVGFLALTGTFGTSYTRARIEGLPRSVFDRGATSLASRDIRLLMIMLGSLLNRGFLTLLLIAMLTNSVVLLRLLTARRALAEASRSRV